MKNKGDKRYCLVVSSKILKKTIISELEKHNLTVRELAEYLGYDGEYVERMWVNKREPMVSDRLTQTMIREFSDFIGLKTTFLVSVPSEVSPSAYVNIKRLKNYLDGYKQD